MDQRFRRGQKLQLEPRNRDVQVEVFPESGGGGVEPGLRPAVLLGDAVGIGEDQVLCDLAERVVAGERRNPLLLLARRAARGRSVKNSVRAMKVAMSPTKCG